MFKYNEVETIRPLGLLWVLTHIHWNIHSLAHNIIETNIKCFMNIFKYIEASAINLRPKEPKGIQTF